MSDSGMSEEIDTPFDPRKQMVGKKVSFGELPPKQSSIIKKEVRRDIGYPNEHDKVGLDSTHFRQNYANKLFNLHYSGVSIQL